MKTKLPKLFLQDPTDICQTNMTKKNPNKRCTSTRRPRKKIVKAGDKVPINKNHLLTLKFPMD